MNDPRIVACRILAGLALVFASAIASATAQRTFVSTSGNDANPCSLASPCRSFAAANTQTSAGGEIIVLDSGGYGAVSIDKPVSITAPGDVYAGISVFGGNAITVNAGGGAVTLTHLTITGLGVDGFGGPRGIVWQSGNTLSLNDVVLSGLVTGLEGLGVSGTLVIRDSAFLGSSYIGANVASSSGLKLQVERSRFDGNHYGINFIDSVAGFISDTTFTNSTVGAGFIQTNAPGRTASFSMQRCFISNNNTGLAFGGASGFGETIAQVTDSEFSDNAFQAVFVQGSVYFSNTRIVRNGIGVFINGGTAVSLGDNIVYGNGSDETFSSLMPKK